MNIGQAARASGVNAKMIRYYEQIGLVVPSERTDGNYRCFDARNVHELRFIKRARTLGFSVEEIATLLSLWRDRALPSAEVKAIAHRHIIDLEVRVAEMRAMADTLRRLAQDCARADRPKAPSWRTFPKSSPRRGSREAPGTDAFLAAGSAIGERAENAQSWEECCQCGPMPITQPSNNGKMNVPEFAGWCGGAGSLTATCLQ